MDKKKGGGGPLSRAADELLKNAPMPVKVMGALVKPAIGALENALAEGAADADEMMLQAQSALRADGRVTALLGPDVAIGAVFSSSSSSSSINGVTRKMMSLQCSVAGSLGSGVVAMQGQSEGGSLDIQSLQVQAAGQVLDVQSLRGAGGGGGSDGVIDIDVM